jgi:hypothetical protein
MALEPVKTWQSTLKDVPTVDDASWTRNFAKWVTERSAGKLQLKPVLGPVSFTFHTATFQSKLETCSPTDRADQAANQIADAWEAAVNASKMSVMTGSFLLVPTPVTTWAAATTVIDGGSIRSAKARLIQDLTQVPPVKDAEESQLCEAMRNAFLALTCTVTGIYLSIPPGPLVGPCLPTA